MKYSIIILNLLVMVLMPLQAQYVFTNPTKVNTDFTTNWSSNTYPRLYGSSQEINTIKDLYTQGNALVKKSVDKIIAEANNALSKPIPVWGLDEANLRVSSVHTISKEFVPQLTIAYLITNDTKYAKRAWEVAKVLMTYQDWGVATTAPFKDRHFLDAGVGAFNAAMLYDGLSAWTNQAQKDSLYQMTKKFIFIPAQAQYNGTATRTWNWMSTDNNWNGICNGGITAACLTMFEHDKTLLSDVASRAINNFANYINAFEPDGQSEEGMMYWSYGLMYTTTAFDIMQRVLGTTYGYGETNGMRKTGYFPVFTSGPVATLNVGDDGIRNSRVNTLMWFSKHFNDSDLAKFASDLFVENGSNMNWFDLFHYSPTLVNQGNDIKIGLDNYIKGIDIYSFIEKWKDPNALYLAVHSGYNNANHGHLDAGSFYIQGLGEYWAYGNLGSDNYTYPGYFDFGAGNNDCLPSYNASNTAPTVPQSWHFYRKRAEGKNVVVYNPDYRADQDPTQEAVYKGFINSSETVGSGAINMNMIYSRDVNLHTRGFKLNRSERVISIQDNISAKANKNIWWSMHTKAAIAISTDKKSAILTQNGKSMKFVIRSPEEGTFQSLNATYLDGRNFPLTTNSANNGFKKLAINLKNTKDAVIRVEAYPTNDGDKEEVIDDFEGFSYNYLSVNNVTIQSNIQNPAKDEINGSDLVMQLTKQANATSESGIKLNNKKISIGVGAGQYRYLKVKLYKSTLDAVKLKLEQPTEGANAEFNSVIQATKTNAWEEFTFDLLKDKDNNSMEGRTFASLTLNPEVASTTGTTIYVDDIRLSNVIDNKPENITFSQQKVGNITFSQRTSASVLLSWNAVNNATSYNVYKDKALFKVVQSTNLQIDELTAAALYKFSVTAQNANGQPSISSDELLFPMRAKNATVEVVDDFETPYLPWEGVGSGATVYSNQANPLSNSVNNSAKCVKILRLAYSTNEIGISLINKDLFDLDLLPRFLHIKLYRGAVVGGISIKLIDANNSNILKRLKPINEADTLSTLKWVDYVFDLSGSETQKKYQTITIFPDLTDSYSSTKNYFIDDVLFSTIGNAFTSVENLKGENKFYDTRFVGNDLIYLSNNNQKSSIQLYSISGQMLKTIVHESGNTETVVATDLKSGIYLLTVESNGIRHTEKIVR